MAWCCTKLPGQLGTLFKDIQGSFFEGFGVTCVPFICRFETPHCGCCTSKWEEKGIGIEEKEATKEGEGSWGAQQADNACTEKEQPWAAV
jgi:hypothetical protein